MEPLTDLELERRKRSFISVREKRLSILALSLVFTATLVATWLASAGLLLFGVRSMPLRYAASILVGYGVFFLAVRVWADYQKAHPADRPKSGEQWPVDVPVVGAEGCLIVLVLFGVGVLVAGVLSWLGTVVMLEVAFEVVFSGILVRRMGKLDRRP
jgi:small neutral amino acid transporter SnatA (MarC family)